MRMPLAAHSDSMLALGVLTGLSPRAGSYNSRPFRPSEPERASHQVAAQYQRRRGAGRALRIIAGAAADLAEARAAVKPAGRLVVLVHFQEHRPHAESGEPPQVQIEQRP